MAGSPFLIASSLVPKVRIVKILTHFFSVYGSIKAYIMHRKIHVGN